MKRRPPRLRTFIDSGVLIVAARGNDALSGKALAILEDPSREFVSREFVRLEVLPKAKYHKRREEVSFYETFFAALGRGRLVAISKALVHSALDEASRAGLGPVDALHVAAAKRSRCKEFFTTEKPEKPLFRVAGLVIRSLR